MAYDYDSQLLESFTQLGLHNKKLKQLIFAKQCSRVLMAWPSIVMLK